jgi:hypothetical protein
VLSTASVGAQNPSAPDRGAASAAAEAGALPMRRVVLYKTGVGYFEHLGTVRSRQDVTIRFTSAQLNDVLKSLTTIDMGNGRITGISYNSIAPIEQRLGALRLPVGAGATMADLLASLRGARVEVSSSAGVTVGRLLSVERRTRPGKEAEAITVDTVSVLSVAGEVQSFDLTPAVRVRILDPDLRQEVGRYLDVVGSSRERDVRQMVITTSGSGERQLFVSYISEVPIWKSTYRLMLRDDGARPLLQGWAIVDNTVGEDWTGVELSLVAGAPQSFVQNISQPYYGRRPTVPLPQAAMMTPQTHDAPLQIDEAASPAALAEAVSVSEASAVAPSGGRGVPGGRIGGVIGDLPSPPPPASVMARQAYDQMTSQGPAAAARPLADLFEYRIKDPVTLQKNQSALVPIVNAEVAAEKIALWNRSSGSGRPLRAVWITNSSGLTLDAGSISVIDGSAFAGEGLIEALKPGERRLLSYAADIGVLVDAKMDPAPTRVLRVRARDGIVIQESEERASWTYKARSEERAPVTLIVEHRARPGWKLAAGQTPAESTPDAHRFRIAVEPQKEITLVVREIRAGETRIAVGDFSDTHIAQLAAQGAATEAFRKALAPIVAKRSEVSAIERQLKALTAQLESIIQDQDRLRENMKALRGSADEKQLLQRYTRQLNEQEDRLDQLRSEISQTTRRRETAREELNALIGSFTFEAG